MGPLQLAIPSRSRRPSCAPATRAPHARAGSYAALHMVGNLAYHQRTLLERALLRVRIVPHACSCSQRHHPSSSGKHTYAAR
eukprot:scaffold155787_cov29-Tisochrysis_lutea.AAC.4